MQTNSGRPACSPEIRTGTTSRRSPLVCITPNQDATLAFRKAGKEAKLKWKDDFVAWTKHVSETAELQDAEMVFVGYGAQAPEFSWDDYKGADLKGKTLIMLVGDPTVPDPALLAGRKIMPTTHQNLAKDYECGLRRTFMLFSSIFMLLGPIPI